MFSIIIIVKIFNLTTRLTITINFLIILMIINFS